MSGVSSSLVRLDGLQAMESALLEQMGHCLTNLSPGEWSAEGTLYPCPGSKKGPIHPSPSTFLATNPGGRPSWQLSPS